MTSDVGTRTGRRVDETRESHTGDGTPEDSSSPTVALLSSPPTTGEPREGRSALPSVVGSVCLGPSPASSVSVSPRPDPTSDTSSTTARPGRKNDLSLPCFTPSPVTEDRDWSDSSPDRGQGRGCTNLSCRGGTTDSVRPVSGDYEGCR